MRLALKLRGTDGSGRKFEEMTTTENVSAAGFLCNCMSALVKGAIVEVTLSGGSERYVGRVRRQRFTREWISAALHAFLLRQDSAHGRPTTQARCHAPVSYSSCLIHPVMVETRNLPVLAHLYLFELYKISDDSPTVNTTRTF